MKIKYRIFFLGYGGAIYDACKNEIFGQDCDIEFDTMEECVNSMQSWFLTGILDRKDLEYTILPVIRFDK